MSDPKPIGESIEDVADQTVSSTSPLEETKTDAGSDEADRNGHTAVDDETFTA